MMTDVERYKVLRDDVPTDVEIKQRSNGERVWVVTFWLSPSESFFDRNCDGSETLDQAIDAHVEAKAHA